MTIDAAKIARLREIAGKATPGPWWTNGRYDGRECGCAIIAARTDCGPLPGNPTRGMVAFASALINTEARQCEATAHHIAAFDPPTALTLLDDLEKARELNEKAHVALGITRDQRDSAHALLREAGDLLLGM